LPALLVLTLLRQYDDPANHRALGSGIVSIEVKWFGSRWPEAVCAPALPQVSR
jgi:hypothetical protein